MSPTSYQAAPPRAIDTTPLASVLQILRCPLRVELGGSGIISLDLCKDPALGASRGHGLHDSSKLDDLVEPFGLGERFVDALAARPENSLGEWIPPHEKSPRPRQIPPHPGCRWPRMQFRRCRLPIGKWPGGRKIPCG